MNMSKEFLQPNSMLTPGIAGGVVTLIANTLWVQFALPAKWVALTISVIISFIVIKEVTGNLYLKATYLVLNALIIFSVSMGANKAGNELASNTGDQETTSLSLISNAYAGVDNSICENYIDEILLLEKELVFVKSELVLSKTEMATLITQQSIDLQKFVLTSNKDKEILKSQLEEANYKLNEIVEQMVVEVEDFPEVIHFSLKSTRRFFHAW